MAFPDSFVEEVRRNADIVRLISEHVSLRKLGASWKGLCPFHQEKTPSFNVRAEPPIFHCFGCGAGGDVFKFVMLHERLSFPEAVESLARRCGVPVPERTADAGPGRKEREELLALLEQAAEHYSRTLWTAAGARAREYLLGRGFRKETLERIRAGAARDAWDDLLGTLRRRFSPAALVSAGLVLERQDKSGHYDRFRNRAIFPILSETGKVVAFGARSLDGSEPKYLNSPETPVYQKGRTLYGLSWAREPIRREGRAVLMEGYLDVARALEAGIGEALATCGTALTPAHARLLRRFTASVCVNFDQDAAGVKAARKSVDLLLEEGFEVRIVTLPEGHDPDSFLKAEGADAYRARLSAARPYMEWLIERSAIENDTRTPAGKAAFLDALLPSLARLDSAVERAAWLPAIVDRGGLDGRAAQHELRRALATRATSLRKGALDADAPPAGASGPSPTARPRPLRPAEKWLVALVVSGAEGAAEALAQLGEAELLGLRCEPILRLARERASRGQALDVGELEAALPEPEQRLLREIVVEGAPLGVARPEECVVELRRRVLEERLARIQRDLGAASGESERALLEEKLEIRRQMAGL